MNPSARAAQLRRLQLQLTHEAQELPRSQAQLRARLTGFALQLVFVANAVARTQDAEAEDAAEWADFATNQIVAAAMRRTEHHLERTAS